MKNKDNLLEVNDLYLNYGSIKAVKGINIHLKKEEIVTLVGANGAGKSSLLKGIMNIEKTKGDIYFKNEKINNLTTEKIVSKGISIIPEGHLIFSSMTVWENLQLGVYQGSKNKDITLEDIYDYFPVLEKRKEQKAGTLSGGEQQMLSIGRALLAGPELLLIDEPSLGLAPQIVQDIFEILKKLNKDGFTILLAEQNVKKSLEIADRVYVLKTGKISKKGNAAQMLAESDFMNLYLN
ncbi:MAG: ABC transporter ATP-binding protein [Bacillota bacterium]